MNRNLGRLIDALRSPMPSNFTWDFSWTFGHREEVCGSVGCAVGLAEILFQVDDLSDWKSDELAEFFGISEQQAYDIFFCYETYDVKSCDDVTATMVADKLEAIYP